MPADLVTVAAPASCAVVPNAQLRSPVPHPRPIYRPQMIRGQDMTPTPEDEYGWHTHNDIVPTMKDHLLPRLDRSLSALLEDLEQRALLETTLVVCMGEFGRAPRVALEPGFAGNIPGRKHWAGAYSVLLAGAGVRGGA